MHVPCVARTFCKETKKIFDTFDNKKMMLKYRYKYGSDFDAEKMID